MIVYTFFFRLLGVGGKIDLKNWCFGHYKFINRLSISKQKQWYSFEWKYLHKPLNFIFSSLMNFLWKHKI